MPMVGTETRSVMSRARGGGDAFEDDGEYAGVLQGLGVAEELGCFLGGLALDTVAPELVYRLGREADVAHDGYAAIDDVAGGVGHRDPTLQLLRPGHRLPGGDGRNS